METEQWRTVNPGIRAYEWSGKRSRPGRKLGERERSQKCLSSGFQKPRFLKQTKNLNKCYFFDLVFFTCVINLIQMIFKYCSLWRSHGQILVGRNFVFGICNFKT